MAGSVELAADSSVNLRNQLGGRARYHQALIKFIGANGLLGRVCSPPSTSADGQLTAVHTAFAKHPTKTRVERGASQRRLTALAVSEQAHGRRRSQHAAQRRHHRHHGGYRRGRARRHGPTILQDASRRDPRNDFQCEGSAADGGVVGRAFASKISGAAGRQRYPSGGSRLDPIEEPR